VRQDLERKIRAKEKRLLELQASKKEARLHTKSRLAGEHAAAGVRGAAEGGLSKGDIQRVVELETQGWQHATFGQQIVSKHQEVSLSQTSFGLGFGKPPIEKGKQKQGSSKIAY
jgi:hypothetical protein